MWELQLGLPLWKESYHMTGKVSGRGWVLILRVALDPAIAWFWGLGSGLSPYSAVRDKGGVGAAMLGAGVRRGTPSLRLGLLS